MSETHDLVREAEPVKGDWLQRGYKLTITHLPWLWRRLYNLAEHLPFDDERLLFLGRVEKRLASVIQDFRPCSVICTFPLYPHLIARIFRHGGAGFPLFTVVTDSITINQVWLSSATDFYLAPDDLSADELRRRCGPAQVLVTGFPVDPVFAGLRVAKPADLPRKALYFPATSRRAVRRALNSLLLDGPPDLELTVVLGRHEARLHPVRKEIEQAFPSRAVNWFGWTGDVPALMQSHDVVIGKAGGATTHECGAAGRPLLITQIVPGQEEGNAELIERRGSGCHEPNPDALGPLLRRLVASGRWRKIRDAAWTHRHPDGALVAARIILNHLS
jgi:processive 1,2-diacylglycerol beta-glucosyltransferase